MIRLLYCLKCAAYLHKQPLVGYELRRTELLAMKPADHGYVTRGEFVSRDVIRCDNCNEAISNGVKLVAITQWNKKTESEPEKWELKYGKETKKQPDDRAEA
jgi:hypothetical protein